MSFDLEKARDLAYQASEHKVWTPPGATGHGSDLNKYREWQAVVEICDKRYPESLDQIADLMQNCNSLRARAQKAEAEIERLRAENVSLLVGIRLGSEQILENQHDIIRTQTARIKELEEALVEERGKIVCYDQDSTDEWWNDLSENGSLGKGKNEIRQEAREQLRAEGKIGPDAALKKQWDEVLAEGKISSSDHGGEANKLIGLNADHPYPAEAPRSWQITDERIRFLTEIATIIDEAGFVAKSACVRAMLEEAGQ